MMRRIWHTLTHMGITEELSPREARRVSYVNGMCIIMAIYVNTRVLFSLSDPSYALTLFCVNLIIVTVLTLNYFRLYNAAKHFSIIGVLFPTIYFVHFQLGGFNEGTPMILFITVPWPFIFFDVKQRGHLLAALGTVLGSFVLLIILSYVHPVPVRANLNMNIVRITVTALTALMLVLATWHFYSSNVAAEAKLLQEKEKADAANRAKSIFLANMSHELRTPLNVILGFTQLMRREPGTTSVQQEHLEVISRSGDHLLQLIDDVLTMSRIEAGRIELDVRPFDLYVTLDNIDSMLRLPAEAKNLSLRMYRDAIVPRYVKTDEVRLRQVLVNILGNAIKFTHNGSVILRVSYESPKEDGPSIPVLRFEVEDTGIGIAATETDRIFDPFVQTERGRSSQAGTGLGLPISRQFVRLMGGDISVTSEVGKGSTFSFHVEIEPAIAEDLLAVDRFHEVIGLALGQPKYRILIVEDNPQNRALLVEMLQPLGFRIREAVNGQEGIEICEEWDPNLIFMDMHMPVMDGFEATRRIKRDPKGKKTKIVAVTASVFEHEQELVMEAGCDDFIRKPIRSEEIFQTLVKHLGVKFRYAESAGEVNEDTQKLDEEDVRKHLRSLPPEWVSRLHEAAVAGDIEVAADLVEEIRERDGVLSDTLRGLVKQYRLGKVAAITEKMERQ